MDVASLLISLASGAVGGNLAGAVLKESSLGTVGNSIAGILGGGIGTALLQSLGLYASSSGSLDFATIANNVAGGGAGGAIFLAIISIIKAALART